MKPDEIYLATVGVEKFRWAKPKRSSIDLHACIRRSAEAGFDGIELWEFHGTGLGRNEITRARELGLRSGCPVTVFSTYVETKPTDENVAHRRRLNEIAGLLGAGAYKYNITAHAGRDEAVGFVRDWAAEADVTFLCECHGGTMMEDPQVAAEVIGELGAELGDDKFGAILHTLTAEDDVFEKDLALKKDLFRHVHVQSAGEHRDRIASRVKRLKGTGLGLTWSVEFSSPVYEKADNDTCFAAAVEDMRFLRDCLR